jgi:DNA-directed RNA polymerase II subunit RPB1
MKAAKHGELDNMRGVSANVMCGQEGFYGTSAFQVILDMDEMVLLGDAVIVKEETVDDIEDIIDKESIHDACSNIIKQQHVELIIPTDLGEDDNYNPFI